MLELTTMNKWTHGNFDTAWSQVKADCIYFAYAAKPDEKLMLVTHQGNRNGLGNRGRVYKADGSHYQGSGMSLIEGIYVFGITLSIIKIGGE